MSKLSIILSFLSVAELKKIHTKIARGKLHDEDLAVEIGDLLEDRETQIKTACGERIANRPFANDDSVYYFIRYYGVDDNRCLYEDFKSYCQFKLLGQGTGPAPTTQG